MKTNFYISQFYYLIEQQQNLKYIQIYFNIQLIIRQNKEVAEPDPSGNHQLTRVGLGLSSVAGFVTGITTGFFFGETIGQAAGVIVGSTTGSILGLTTGFVEGSIKKLMGQQANIIDTSIYFAQMGFNVWLFGQWGAIAGNQMKIELYQYFLNQIGIINTNQIVEQQKDEDQNEEFEIIQIENNKQEEKINKIIKQD